MRVKELSPTKMGKMKKGRFGDGRRTSGKTH